MDYADYFSEAKGYSGDVDAAMSGAKSAYSTAQNVVNAAAGHKEALGGALTGIAGGAFAGIKYINKVTGLKEAASEGMEDIRSTMNLSSQARESQQAAELADAKPPPEYNPTFSKDASTAGSDEPAAPEDADAAGEAGGEAAGEAGGEAAGEVGGEAAAELGVDAVLAETGAALSATGIGAVAGVALEAAAVIGTAVAGITELFEGHDEKQPDQPKPDLTIYAQPVFQAGIS